MLHRRFHIVGPILTGGLLALALSPLDWMWVGWLAPLPLLLCWNASRISAELLYGAYVGGLIFHLAGMDWLRTCYGGSGLSGPNAWEWLLLSVLLAVTWPLVAGAGVCLARWFPIALAAPIAWTTGEYARYHGARFLDGTGCPWLQLGFCTVRTPDLMQLADVGGVWLVGALIAMVAGAAADLIQTPRRPASRWAAALSGLLIGAAWLYGRVQLNLPIAETGPRVLAGDERQFFQALSSPTQPPWAASTAADIVIFPEKVAQRVYALSTDGECLLTTNAAASEMFLSVLPTTPVACRELAAMAQRVKATIVVGAERCEPTAFFNTALVLDASGAIGCQDKVALVPWSEFVPFTCPFVEAVELPYCRGKRTRDFPWKNNRSHGRFATCVCYDVCFPYAVHQRHVPDFYAVLSCETADASGWLQQLTLRHTQFRAIELRRPFVRTVENGWSGLVDSRGMVRIARYTGATGVPTGAKQTGSASSENTVGLVSCDIPLDSRGTFYSVAGDWWPQLASIVSYFAVMTAWLGYLRRNPRVTKAA